MPRNSLIRYVAAFVAFLSVISKTHACPFPTIITCQSQQIEITLCLDRDPNTCTSTLQCNILGVYDTVKDPHLEHNEIIPDNQTGPAPGTGSTPPSNTIISYVVFQTKLGSAIANNLYPLDPYGVAFNDAHDGPSNLYTDNIGNLLVIDNNVYEGFCAMPTAMPTAAPSSKPTSIPTASPTKSPTAAPSSKPTSIPTASPTAASTAIPTATPTSTPTAAPTAASTATPTALPSSIHPTTAAPTYQPIARTPTSQPSFAPTAAPTCAAVSTTDQAYFTVTQQLLNLTSSYFSGSSTAAQAFTDTVSAVLGCTAPTTVTVTGSSRRRLQQSAVPVATVDYKIIFGYNGLSSAGYIALITVIDNAVTTGQFTALLRSHASLLGVSALDLPTFSNYTVLPPSSNTNSNGNASTAASSSNAGVIAGSVVAVLVALFACLLLVFCCRRAPADQKKAGDEPHSDVFTVWR